MNDFSYLIEYLRIGRRQEDAAKRELRFEVIIVNQNYNIEAMESTQYILKTDFDNPALITPLADILEGHEELFFTNDAGTLTYYIRREPANNTYEYRNILSGGWITLSDQTLYSVPIPFSKELYFYSEVYRSVILKQLDEILPITDWFIYHPNDTPMINDGEYGFDYKDDHGNSKNDPLKLIFLQFISATVSTYKRNVTVGKSPFSNKTYLFPIVSKMSNRYILKYHIKTDDPLETLRFQEIWSIRLEFTYLGSCLEFLNQTIMHDYDGLNWETKPRKAFLDSYKTIVNNALTAANFGSIENVLEILYYLPKAFIKEIDKNLLWNFLDRSLEGLVTNIGLDKEDLVLVLLEALSEVERTPTIFLSELIQPKSGGESRFLLLYKKINGENFKQTIQLLYKFWLKSAFSDIDNPVFKNSDGPLFLPYKSDKFLGFYSSNKNFEFQKDNTILVTPDDHYIDEIISVANPAFRNVISDVIEDQIEYHYHPFQPVYLTETEQEAEIDLPKIVPAFFIKANEDKTFWANVITGIEYTLDILTILSGIGNITKFRYLYRLGQAAGAMGTFRLAAGAIEISSGAVSAMVKLSGTKNEFALALQKHLLYLELVALSGEISIAIRNRLKSSAREVINNEKEILDELNKLDEIDELQKAGFIDEIKKIAGDYVDDLSTLRIIPDLTNAAERKLYGELRDLFYKTYGDLLRGKFLSTNQILMNWKKLDVMKSLSKSDLEELLSLRNRFVGKGASNNVAKLEAIVSINGKNYTIKYKAISGAGNDFEDFVKSPSLEYIAKQLNTSPKELKKFFEAKSVDSKRIMSRFSDTEHKILATFDDDIQKLYAKYGKENIQVKELNFQSLYAPCHSCKKQIMFRNKIYKPKKISFGAVKIDENSYTETSKQLNYFLNQ